MLGFYYAEKKETDGDFHKCKSDKGLNPVGPAQDQKQSSLGRSQVVLVSSQSADHLGGNQSSPDEGRHLVKVDRSIVARQG